MLAHYIKAPGLCVNKIIPWSRFALTTTLRSVRDETRFMVYGTVGVGAFVIEINGERLRGIND